jgi:hypothetical protein
MRLVELVEDPAVARRILSHLGLPTGAPPRPPPWRPAREHLAAQDPAGFDAIDPPSRE